MSRKVRADRADVAIHYGEARMGRLLAGEKSDW
jgi:hypothetical protein